MRTIAQSEDEKAKPETGYAAQFSGPFTVATVLVGDQGLGVSLDDFTAEEVKDPVKLDLAPCVASPTRSATASSRTSFRLSCASG